jgi:cell division protein FtsI (penicillin-binding protein 3)
MKARRPRPRKRSWQPALRWQVDLPVAAEPDGVVRARANLRILAVAAAIGLGYLILLGQASALMLMPDPQLEAKASDQFEDAVEIHGRRGDIVDRNGQLLATTVDLSEVRADPKKLDQATVGALAATLAPLLHEDAASSEAKLRQA